MKKKTYFKPETTLHTLYTEHGLMLKASEEDVDQASSDDAPTTVSDGEAWGDSHRRDYETNW